MTNGIFTAPRLVVASLAALAFATLTPAAQAQYASQRPGGYFRGANGVGINPANQSVHIPGQAVVKPSGVYTPIGNGYYQNAATGNKYNPNTGSYLQGTAGPFGSVATQRPGGYFRDANGVGINPINRSVHVPGQAVVKPSGVYTPIGNGYYRNPTTGNVYNPNTGSYIYR